MIKNKFLITLGIISLFAIPITTYVFSRLNQQHISTSQVTIKKYTEVQKTTPTYAVKKGGVDFSYIWLYVDENIDLVVKNDSNLQVGEDFIQQPLRDPVSGKLSGKLIKEFLFPKPPNGNYQITLSTLKQQEYKLEILLYDREGNHKRSSFSGILEPNRNYFYRILFDKENVNNSSINPK